MKFDASIVSTGREPARECLESLGAADLAAVRASSGVVRHVLRLERSDPQAPPPCDAAEGSGEDRFADVRSGALEHECFRCHGGHLIEGAELGLQTENQSAAGGLGG